LKLILGRFGKKPSDYYDLVRLDPSYTVILSEDEVIDLPANYSDLRELFETYEPGAADALDRFWTKRPINTKWVFRICLETFSENLRILSLKLARRCDVP
jgi:phytoene dehydrogenase-like protein